MATGRNKLKRTETNWSELNESECLDSYEYLPGWSLNKDIPVLSISLSLSLSVYLFSVQLRRRQSSSVHDDDAVWNDALAMLYSVAALGHGGSNR